MFRLLLVTDRRLCGGSPSLLRRLATVARAVTTGLAAVQVREKDLSARDLLELASAVRAEVGQFGMPVIVNDRLDVAIAAGADGVHLPASGLDPGAVRERFGGLIGVSVHSAAEAASLDPQAVDYATFGPVFETASKRPYGPPQGVERLREAVRVARVPVFAIGGISSKNMRESTESGIAGIAVISAVLGSEDPASPAVELLDLIGFHSQQGQS
jgi:thiamine-phosphate pyrophosphorylase